LANRLLAAWNALFEKRQSPENPSTPLSAPAGWLFDMLGGYPTLSGARVNQRSALNNIGLDACLRVIAGGIGALPCHVYRRISPKEVEKAFDRREYTLLHDSPNPRMTSCVFREVLTLHALLYGNGYALIEFDMSGKVRALWPLMSELVKPILGEDGSLEYIVTDAAGNEKKYPSDEIIHIPDMGLDGVNGLSRVMLHKEGIGLGQALEAFGSEYFGHGTAPSGIITIAGKLSDPAKERLKQSWHSSHGVPGQRHKVPIFEEGMDYKGIALQADHAQFIESRKFQLSEMERMMGVKPHKIGDLEKATFSNIEHQAQEHIEDTLRPWVVRWEQELTRKLFPKSDLFIELNLDGLLRADFNTRMEGYSKGRQWGWLSVNDIREKENMNPLPGKDGDQYLVPTNMTTPELLANPPKPAPAKAPIVPIAEAAGMEKQRVKAIIRPVFADTIKRALTYDRKDPIKLERYVSRAFASVLKSIAVATNGDVDVAIHYAGLLHARVAEWDAERNRRQGQDEPMSEIFERELEMAFNFISEKEQAA
jgi:HK97 family phage portal protein